MDYAFTMRQILISVIPILIAIILHEVAHGFVAYKLGDPTAKVMGRLTLNPVSHIDPIGTILMPLLLYVFTNGQFVFGYAKPVPINPYNFRNPKRDMAIASIGGPATNIALAVISTLLLKYVLIPLSIIASAAAVAKIFEPLAMMLKASIVINVILATFNMIPIPPLDGGRVLMGLLPTKQASVLGRIEPFGLLIVILFVATGMANYIVRPVILLILSLIGMR